MSQTFTKNPQKSKQRASIELGISSRSLSRLMQHLGLKMYWPNCFMGYYRMIRMTKDKAMASLTKLHGPMKLILNFEVL